MKKIFLMLLFLLLVQPVQAETKDTIFVSYNGSLFELNINEELASEVAYGEKFGEVNLKVDKLKEPFEGNVSNYFEVGAEYYSFKDVPIEKGFAVKQDSVYYMAISIENNEESAVLFIVVMTSALACASVAFSTLLLTKKNKVKA